MLLLPSPNTHMSFQSVIFLDTCCSSKIFVSCLICLCYSTQPLSFLISIFCNLPTVYCLHICLWARLAYHCSLIVSFIPLPMHLSLSFPSSSTPAEFPTKNYSPPTSAVFVSTSFCLPPSAIPTS